jgi:hypothetical protein
LQHGPVPLSNHAKEPATQPEGKPTLGQYAAVGAFLLLFCVLLGFLGGDTPSPLPMDALIAPMAALVALTALVWLLMVVVRNAAVMLGRISAMRFVHYAGADHDERIERPARAFNNLFQVPMLFYVACLLMMITTRVDRHQLELAWVFVGMRALHAVVYVGWNHLPSRFATWIASCIALGVIWTRLVLA